MIDLYNMTGLYDGDALRSSIGFSHSNITDLQIKKAQRARIFVVDFVKANFWLGAQKYGALFSSGSESNEIALLVAKKNQKNPIIIGTSLTHNSIKYACNKLDLEYKEIPVQSNSYKVSTRVLEEFINANKDNPLLICLTMGTTQLGSVSDFELTDKFQKLVQGNVSLHIDAAYGGPILSQIKSFSYLEKFMNLASTATIDVHKFLGPIGCSVLVLNQALTDIFIAKDQYFDGVLSYFGTSRSAYAAEVARKIMIKHGSSKLANLAEKCITLAEKTKVMLSDADVEFFPVCETGVVAIKYGSELSALKIQEDLRKKGYLVSAVRIRLENGHYESGIRITVTPKKEMTPVALKNFTNTYKDILKSY